MWFSLIRIQNLRGFVDSGEIKLGRQSTVLVGPNNGGKSTVLHALHHLQNGGVLPADSTRPGSEVFQIELEIQDWEDANLFTTSWEKVPDISPRIYLKNPGWSGQAPIVRYGEHQHGGVQLPFPNVEPINHLYPYLSKRKVVSFSEDVNREATLSVRPDLNYLVAKIDRLSNPELKNPKTIYILAP